MRLSFPPYAAQARYWLGVALSRRGQAAAAARTWEELVARFPTAPWAARALWALAVHAQRAGRVEAADRWLRVLSARFPRSVLGAQARWQRGWLRYLAGRYEDAERLWREAAAAGPPGLHAAAAYWAAQSRLRRGLDGRPLLEQAARWPLSYYGQRARQRLGVAALPAPSRGPVLSLPRDRFARAEVELAALGFFREAVEEAVEVVRRGPSRFARRILAWARARAADLPGSVAAAESLAGPWAQDPTSTERGLWELAYPLAHLPAVQRWAALYGVDPYLLLAVMREESRFDPGAVSPAGAVGLMQLLPSAARGIDPGVGILDLTDPSTNVRLGTAYLAGRLREFGGDVVLALVAYNAGPGAARRFLQLPASDRDEFVERIPYAETRAYVKRVLESYGVYRWLYGR